LNKVILYFTLILLAVLPLPISAQDSSLSTSNTEFIDTIISDDIISQGEINTENKIYPLSDERKEKLHTYSQFVVLWRFISFIIGITILYLILRLRLSSKFRDWSKLIKNEFLSMWVYLIIFFSFFYFLNLPFKIYREILVEQEFGFFSQTVSSWVFGEIKFLLLTYLFGIIPFYVFYKLVGKIKNWWIWYTLGSIPVIITVVIISPILIMPLFDDYEPLKDKCFKEIYKSKCICRWSV
jgi:STE24 endopeptidase